MGSPDNGFHCEWCGEWHKFSIYVYAHMRDVLTHTCKFCGAKHEIVMMSAGMSKKGRKDLKDGRTAEGP